MTDTKRIMVLGASGFVGSAAADAIEIRGHEVARDRAPRLPAMEPAEAASYIAERNAAVQELARKLRGFDAVINAAGDPDASSRDTRELVAVNGALPGFVAAAAAAAGVPRFVHISSAVVQGRLRQLDESENTDAFSDYSKSKLLGERLAHRFSSGEAVIYRPPSVHSAERRVTRMTSRIAASPLRSVANPGTSPSPQALIRNVADAVAFLAVTDEVPPQVVIHPWEGLSTADVMLLLGGRRPVFLPRLLASGVGRSLSLLGKALPAVAANARRIEMLWFGQRQAPSWLTRSGWTPPDGRGAWMELGRTVRARNAGNRSEGKVRG